MTQFRALLLFIVTLAFGAAPFLSEPFRGYPAGSFPVDILRPSIQPAGYAFAIWGLIYLWLIVHSGFGLLQQFALQLFVRVLRHRFIGGRDSLIGDFGRFQCQRLSQGFRCRRFTDWG